MKATEQAKEILKKVREENRAATNEEVILIKAVFAEELAAEQGIPGVYKPTINSLVDPGHSRFAAYTLLQAKKLAS